MVIAELLAERMAALSPEDAAAMAGRLHARAGYLSADPGYDPVERHTHEVAAAMDLLLHAADRRAIETATVRRAARHLPSARGEAPLRRANGGIEPVGVLD